MPRKLNFRKMVNTQWRNDTHTYTRIARKGNRGFNMLQHASLQLRSIISKLMHHVGDRILELWQAFAGIGRHTILHRQSHPRAMRS